MKPIKPALLATVAIIALLPLSPAIAIAAPDAARVYGDIRVDGIVFNLDGSNMQTKASPWSFLGPDIFYNGGNIGIGSANTPTARLDVNGSVNATNFTGDGSTLSNLWKTTGNAATNPTTNFLGTTDNQPFEIRVNNTRAFRIEPNATSPNIALGYSGNVAGGSGSYGATVSGGGYAVKNYINTASNSFATVAGGSGNTASGLSATVGGGTVNTAGGLFATVGGGYGNTASNTNATVGGGEGNTASSRYATVNGGSGNSASGFGATVSGGAGNTAGGDYSFAAGAHAVIRDATAAGNTTGDQGTFLWSDSNMYPFNSITSNEFAVRVTGGMRFVTAIDGTTGASTRTTTFDSTGNVNIDPSGSINFGATTRQMLNLLGPPPNNYGIGVQDYTLYFRTGAGSSFSWHFGGSHVTAANNPGAGGSEMMRLNSLGNLYVTGSVTSPFTLNSSDIRLKTEIRPLQDSLDKVLRLRGVSYVLKADETRSRKIGVIAQELEQEYPELVATDDKGMKSVAYANLTAVLIEAVKGLKAENDALKTDNNTMKLRLERLESILVGQ